MSLCKVCGENECYSRNGHEFALCASCAWARLMEFLDLPDTERSPTTRGAVASKQECPDCGGCGYLLDEEGNEIECLLCM